MCDIIGTHKRQFMIEYDYDNRIATILQKCYVNKKNGGMQTTSDPKTLPGTNTSEKYSIDG